MHPEGMPDRYGVPGSRHGLIRRHDNHLAYTAHYFDQGTDARGVDAIIVGY
jgi:hypothetical protein